MTPWGRRGSLYKPVGGGRTEHPGPGLQAPNRDTVGGAAGAATTTLPACAGTATPHDAVSPASSNRRRDMGAELYLRRDAAGACFAPANAATLTIELVETGSRRWPKAARPLRHACGAASRPLLRLAPSSNCVIGTSGAGERRGLRGQTAFPRRDYHRSPPHPRNKDSGARSGAGRKTPPRHERDRRHRLAIQAAERPARRALRGTRPQALRCTPQSRSRARAVRRLPGATRDLQPRAATRVSARFVGT
jgi:hypothetical protein